MLCVAEQAELNMDFGERTCLVGGSLVSHSRIDPRFTTPKTGVILPRPGVRNMRRQGMHAHAHHVIALDAHTPVPFQTSLYIRVSGSATREIQPAVLGQSRQIVYVIHVETRRGPRLGWRETMGQRGS